MSTKLHDLETHLILANSIAPIVANTNQNGQAADLLPGDGNAFAMLLIGALAAGTTVGGRVQEADATAGPWNDVPEASFSNVTASNSRQVLTFQRAKRFVRCVVTITGTEASAAIAAVVGQQSKRT